MQLLIKGNMRDHDSHRNVLYFDYINVDILITILPYSFASCYIWGKLAKNTEDLIVLFL